MVSEGTEDVNTSPVSSLVQPEEAEFLISVNASSSVRAGHPPEAGPALSKGDEAVEGTFHRSNHLAQIPSRLRYGARIAIHERNQLLKVRRSVRQAR